MGVSNAVPAPRRGRQYPPKQYPAQMILVTTDDQDRFVRTYATLRNVSVTHALRDLVQGGVDTLPPQVHQAVLDALAAEEDDEEEDIPNTM